MFDTTNCYRVTSTVYDPKINRRFQQTVEVGITDPIRFIREQAMARARGLACVDLAQLIRQKYTDWCERRGLDVLQQPTIKPAHIVAGKRRKVY